MRQGVRVLDSSKMEVEEIKELKIGSFLIRAVAVSLERRSEENVDLLGILLAKV